jgi:FMN phosphatase YigB (HAD superfamily)
MKKNIIIDFGGVLGTDSDTIFIVTLSKHGIPKESALEIWKKHWPAMGNGSEHVEAVWKTVKEYTTSDINDVISDYNDLISVNHDMLKICSDLKKKGHKMGILANETLEWMDIKREKGKLNDIFDVVYSSADVKFPKPQKEAYLKTLKSLNAKPNETLFIDDKERNTKAAEALGMQSLVFKNIIQLKKDLSEISVI